MPEIHPTSVVHPEAKLAQGVVVGPFCCIGEKATIGENTRLISHVTIVNRTTIGRNNIIWPQTTLGGDPQDLKFHGEDAQLIIGDDNEIREMVTMHIGTENGGGITRVGSKNLIMVGVHVAHDCILGNEIIIANAVQLAGHIQIDDCAVISGATAIHHFVSIGRSAFLGGMTRIVNDVPPFMKVEGNPSRVRGVNTIGLERRGYSPESLARLKDCYRILFRNDGEGPSNMIESIVRLNEAHPDDPDVQELVAFMRRKSTSPFGRYLETLRHDPRHPAAASKL